MLNVVDYDRSAPDGKPRGARVSTGPLLLDRVYRHSAEHPDMVLMTQPIGAGQVVDITWGQALDEARRMAAHLRSLQVRPGARIAMLAKNSAHFIIAELAIWMAGGTTVAIFPTETAANIRYVLEHSEASLLFVGKLDDWDRQRPGVPDGLPCIALPLTPVKGLDTWADIIAHTAPLPDPPVRAADEVAMLLYTSGSTGQPKGVMQTFGSITRRSEAIRNDPGVQLPDGVPWRTLSYLPLAHVYERSTFACRVLYRGDGHLFFGDTQATFMEDLRRARPTVFCSVPRLWLKFQQSVLADRPAAQLEALLDNPATAPDTRREVLASLGLDEVRMAFSGSAPVAPSLLEWYRRLGLNMIEGYGMTEDFAMSHRTGPGFSEPGHVGVPLPGVEVRIAEDGEVLIKSLGAMAGYYKQPELTAQSFTDDGFFRTGDLGERRADGQLRLTGRKKELFKTAKGKYVAPAPIENQLNAHPMVELSLVSGAGEPAPYALVVLNEQLRPRLADPAVRRHVEAEMGEALSKINETLASHERLRMLVVASSPWSIENGCLTPTMKIKRSRIESDVADAVRAWYSQAGPVVWA
jgi:long-chain acyl-CoA synthetase